MNLAAAEALQTRSNKSLDALDTSLGRMKTLEEKQRAIAGQTADAENKLRDLQAADATLRRDQFVSAADVLKISEKLDERMNAIDASVQDLARGQKPSQVSATQVAAAKPSAPSIQVALQRATKRQYSIEVSRLPNIEALVTALTQQGYSASIYDSPLNDTNKIDKVQQDEAVWVGSDVPFNVVIDILRVALAYLPSLKYVYINGDRGEGRDDPREVYIGGATATAKEYGLSPFSSAEFTELLSSSREQDFRSRIRTHYPSKTKAAT
jgi:hypothetical protein